MARAYLTGKCRLAYRTGVVTVFDALAAPARRAILDELRDRDGQTLYELCVRLTMKHRLDLTRQAVSQHLAVLEAVGLITTERKGRYKLHHLDLTPLAEVLARWTRPTRRGARR